MISMNIKHLTSLKSLVFLKILKAYFTGLYIRFCGRPAQLQKAIRKAKRLNKKTGRRYRVFFFGYKYRVWNRDDIRKQIKSGLFKHELKAGADFDKIAFFDTDSLDSLNPLKSL
ncbi:hypothetical protein FACS1894162_3580 [Bacteroidia bacterium]|nr:hypothetical protein FACS1894162_3580 [Bacteroidia bacterium]